jgi:hypothetical protein
MRNKPKSDNRRGHWPLGKPGLDSSQMLLKPIFLDNYQAIKSIEEPSERRGAWTPRSLR